MACKQQTSQICCWNPDVTYNQTNAWVQSIECQVTAPALPLKKSVARKIAGCNTGRAFVWVKTHTPDAQHFDSSR